MCAAERARVWRSAQRDHRGPAQGRKRFWYKWNDEPKAAQSASSTSSRLSIWFPLPSNRVGRGRHDWDCRQRTIRKHVWVGHLVGHPRHGLARRCPGDIEPRRPLGPCRNCRIHRELPIPQRGHALARRFGRPASEVEHANHLGCLRISRHRGRSKAIDEGGKRALTESMGDVGASSSSRPLSGRIYCRDRRTIAALPRLPVCSPLPCQSHRTTCPQGTNNRRIDEHILARPGAATYRERRDLVVSLLNRVSRVSC
jgi:hypothetical protein